MSILENKVWYLLGGRDMDTLLIFIIEIIGTIAFSVSGRGFINIRGV